MSQQRKKQNLDKSAQDPVVYFDSRRIPFEVWENEIFRYTGKNLLKLSMVCKNFYQIIGNSPEVMDKIVLKFDGKSKAKEILKLPRNYTNIRFEYNCDKETCFTILQKYGSKLRILEIEMGGLNEKDLINILELVKNNLRELIVNRVAYLDNSKLKKSAATRSLKAFQLEKLEKLVISNLDSENIMQVLLDVLPHRILEVSYSNKLSNNYGLLKFLESQKNLKHMKLTMEKIQNFEIFEKIDCAKIKFKLETFEYHCKQPSNLPNNVMHIVDTPISKFLVTQAESLKLLKLENIFLEELDAAFECMPQLQVLEIVYGESSSFFGYGTGPMFSCPSLKKLIINLKEYNPNLSDLNFFEKFLKNVDVVVKLVNHNEFFAAFVIGRPIKKLILTKFNDDLFRYDSVKSLSELVIEHGKGMEWKMENAIIAMENLIVLKLGGRVALSLESLLWILVNFKKLKHLHIENGSKLKIVNLCRIAQHFKDLRYLKVNGLNAEQMEQIDNFAACLSGFTDLKCSLSKERQNGFDSWINEDNYNDYDVIQ